jgi:uncharacterized 2Fe-2S/4Fe-4S cluster protein (DUF4445 family)
MLMPVLHIHSEHDNRRISFATGASLLETLKGAAVQIRSGCSGGGTCGLCQIRIISGTANQPTATEQLRLSPEQLHQQFRLACQVRLQQDLAIRVINSPPSTAWRDLPERECAASSPSGAALADPCRMAGDTTRRLGVAVDLGTTHICLTLRDLATGQRLTGLSGLNPQHRFGSDLMARLVAASASQQAAAEIGLLVQEAIGAALRLMAAETGADLQQIEQVLIVGNSAMLALLSGRNHHLLLQPTYWSGAIDCLPLETDGWRTAWGLHPGAAIELVPPLAGFVGSDLLVGILATRLNEQTAPALLIDFGTNSEIALWDRSRLWVTSAAGGPAFEGCGIRCGMPAEPGAICRIEPKETEPGFALEVIGGGEAQGLCGSALVDLIASLLKDGTLNSVGRFTRTIPAEGLVLSRGELTVAVMKSDIDLFQRAKAAIGAGIVALLHRSGIQIHELTQVFVCGAFGRFLNVRHAQAIGLLPDLPPEAVALCGNTALAGCEQLLLSPERPALLAALKKSTCMVNMAQDPEFERMFVENLYLRPLRLQ